MQIRDRIVELRRVPAGSLLPNPKNWRTHPEAQADALRGLLAEVGFAGALLARETENGLMLIDGHLRAETTPDQELPVLVTDLDEAEADLLLASFDPVSGMAGVDEEALASLVGTLEPESEAVRDLLASLLPKQEPKQGRTDPDEIPEVEDAISKSGDLWVLGRHRVLCGDATVQTDVDRLMGGTQADLVWTDPPYGVAVGDKNRWLNTVGPSNRIERNIENDTLGEVELLQLLRDAFVLAVAVCSPGASWYVAAPAGPLHLLFGQALRELGIWRQTIQWVKNNATFSPMGVSYHWQAEPIFYGWVPNGAHRFFGDRKQTTVWEVDRPTASPDHPTMKPVVLVERSIEHTTEPGNVVLDMFGGSGTTLIASERLGRDARLLELDPHYCDVIVRRWEEFTGEKAALDG